jgi:hypothetical protein
MQIFMSQRPVSDPTLPKRIRTHKTPSARPKQAKNVKCFKNGYRALRGTMVENTLLKGG